MDVLKIRLTLVFGIVAVTASASGDWKTDANTRIEQIRKRDAHITVVDSTGCPVSDVDVQIKQIKHRFAFGACINNANNNMSNTNYTNFFKNHFEWAVCENESKWATNEPSRDYETYVSADIIYNWCAANGIIMRGHCLFWEQTDYVQQWVKNLSYATYPTTPSDLLTEVDERINSAVNHFKNKFRHWDVDNEMLSSSFYDRLGEGGRVHMFQLANQVDPNCKLFMNEYSGNSFGGYDATAYVNRCTSLRNAGAPIRCIGIQGHVSPTFDPQNYWNNVLKPLGTLGLPIWVTEFDYSEADENLRADGMENFYRIAFSDPNVGGILMWGFWQNSHWRTNWWIVNSDWTLNVAGVRYETLMAEWTTNDANTTDSAGKVNFRGFHGTYKITLTIPGVTTEVKTIELEPGSTPAEFVLEMESIGGPVCFVGFDDFARFAQYWMDIGAGLPADLDGDNDVDAADLSRFVDHWLACCPYNWPLR